MMLPSLLPGFFFFQIEVQGRWASGEPVMREKQNKTHTQNTQKKPKTKQSWEKGKAKVGGICKTEH